MHPTAFPHLKVGVAARWHAAYPRAPKHAAADQRTPLPRAMHERQAGAVGGHDLWEKCGSMRRSEHLEHQAGQVMTCGKCGREGGDEGSPNYNSLVCYLTSIIFLLTSHPSTYWGMQFAHFHTC